MLGLHFGICLSSLIDSPSSMSPAEIKGQRTFFLTFQLETRCGGVCDRWLLSYSTVCFISLYHHFYVYYIIALKKITTTLIGLKKLYLNYCLESSAHTLQRIVNSLMTLFLPFFFFMTPPIIKSVLHGSRG